MVKREIERRQHEGVPPDPHETGLVAYALALRAAGAPSPGSDTEPIPTQPIERDEQPGHLCLRVAFTGAFLTGYPLAIRNDGYRPLQLALSKELKRPDWRFDGLHVEGGTYESGGGFTEAAPLVIARREGADLLSQLSSAVDDCDNDGRRRSEMGPLLHPAPILTATPKSLAIDVYDLGVAVMTAWFEVAATGNDLEAIGLAVKRLVGLRPGEGRSPLADAFQEIAFATAEQYGEAVVTSARKELQPPWSSPAMYQPRTGTPVELPSDERGRLLWLHPVQILRTRDVAPIAAKELTPAFRRTIPLKDGVFAAGIGSSAVVVAPDSRADSTPVRLTQLHWAYYALYMAIDRGLLGILNEERWTTNSKITQLETDAEDVFGHYLRVMNARARLDSVLNALGGDELAIWETIAKVQRFDTVVDSVERKLDVLEKLAERRVEQANEDRTRRIGNILGLLSALTVVTVAGALIGVFLGSRSQAVDSIWWRVAIIAAAAVATFALYSVFFLRSARSRERDSGWWRRS